MYEEKTHFGKLLLKQSETILTHLTRWPWPLTQLHQNQSGQSLRKVGQGVLELLIGNKKRLQTDRQTDQTDQPTNMCKAICPLFIKGGGITINVQRKGQYHSGSKVQQNIPAILHSYLLRYTAKKVAYNPQNTEGQLSSTRFSKLYRQTDNWVQGQ